MADEPILVEEKEEVVVDENESPIATGPFKLSFSKQEFADLYQKSLTRSLLTVFRGLRLLW